MGLGQEYQLLDWLDQVTFPTEAKYVDEQYAEFVYNEVVKRNLNAGVGLSCILDLTTDHHMLLLWNVARQSHCQARRCRS
jgi:cytosine/adenosine deaminase-related metal-dependent hydrolase